MNVEKNEKRLQDLERAAARWRLVDNHASILFVESESNLSRIKNLDRLWRAKSKVGFLPHADIVGIIGYVAQNCLNFEEELNKRFDKTLLQDPEVHQFPERNFEDIYDLTDMLFNIHRDIALCERAYWQRLEKFDLEGRVPLGDSAIAEYGDIQQIYNAADFLCHWYYKSIVGENNPWTGLVLFGQYHEFRRRGPFFFCPNYVKTCNYRMWTYFSHEIAHQVIEMLSSNEALKNIYNELVSVIRKTKRLSSHALPEYLAGEVIADIISTINAGEEYILTLAELKYYPSFVKAESKTRPNVSFLLRPIRCPMILRVLTSCWTIRIVWGFTLRGNMGRKREDSIFREVLGKIRQEDDITKYQIEQSIRLAEKEIMRLMALDSKHIPKLNHAIIHLNALQRECLQVVNEILNGNIIVRIKELIKNDFYGTEPKEYYFEWKKSPSLRMSDLYSVSMHRLARTSSAMSIEAKRKKRLRELKKIHDNIKGFILAPANPRDVVAALSKISREGKVTKISPVTPYDHVAIMTIALNDVAKDERFVV